MKIHFEKTTLWDWIYCGVFVAFMFLIARVLRYGFVGLP